MNVVYFYACFTDTQKNSSSPKGNHGILIDFIIWLAPSAVKMNQGLRCDWLPKRARWSYLALPRLSAVSREKNFTESHIINILISKLVR